MSHQPVNMERRAAQRFEFHLPVCLRLSGDAREGSGLTQDLSASGVLVYSDFPLTAADDVELTLVMPSEITLAENMRVCCRGKVLRVTPPAVGSQSGVAVHFVNYEFLPEMAGLGASERLSRVSGLHQHANE